MDKEGYRRTMKGLVVYCYAGMRRRVQGKEPRHHRYRGLELVSREEFYHWALGDSGFLLVYGTWVDSGHNKRLTPSIDRIKPELGYAMGNMQWITVQENSRKSVFERAHARNRKAIFVGVTFHGHCPKPWCARIRPHGQKRLTIGWFSTAEEAARAYDRWSFKERGFKVNFP